MGILLGVLSDCEELVGLLTGDDVTNFARIIRERDCYCRTPSELYLTRKMSELPENVLPSNTPPAYPVM